MTPIQKLIDEWLGVCRGRKVGYQYRLAYGECATKLKAAYTGSFAWAMGKLLTVPGAKVRREGWDEWAQYVALPEDRNYPRLYTRGDSRKYDFDRDDMHATDWVVVDEGEKP